MPTYQELFDEVIGTEPPPRLDVDQLMTRSRRRLARRRIAGVVAASLGVVVVAVGVSAVASRQSSGQERFGHEPTPTATAPSPTPSPEPTSEPIPSVGPQPTEPPSAAGNRLTAAMQAAVLRVVPGGELLPYESVGSDRPFQLPPSGRGEPVLPYRGWASLLIAGRAGHPILYIEVGVIGSEERPSCVGKPECLETTGPRGERIVALTQIITRDSDHVAAQDIQDVNGFIHTVWVEHPAGDYVRIEHSNFPEGGGAPVQSPVLSPVEMEQIALDPALTLYP
jgi:hypothetical protein